MGLKMTETKTDTNKQTQLKNLSQSLLQASLVLSMKDDLSRYSWL